MIGPKFKIFKAPRKFNEYAKCSAMNHTIKGFEGNLQFGKSVEIKFKNMESKTSKGNELTFTKCGG